MFNLIKIDKLRLVYKKKELSQEQRTKIDDILRTSYPDYTLFNKAGFVLSTFTPTKQQRVDMLDHSHNLQMPPLSQLQEMLRRINISNDMWFSIIHLAKDIILTNPVNDYLQMLADRLYNRIEPELIESEGIYSLYFTYAHNDNSRVKFIIKLYNKAEEYYKRHNTYICPLYEPLTKEEIKQVGRAYNPKTSTLNLKGLNLLRIEIALQGADKLSPLTNLLSNNEQERFTVDLLVNSIRKGTLYKDLDRIFTNILQKIIFNTKETLKTATADVSEVRKLACGLLIKSSDFYTYKTVADELGLQNQFSEIGTIIRKVTPDSELYTELYNKLSHRVTTLRLIGSCNSYSSIHYKDINLIYDVLIWDDS